MQSQAYASGTNIIIISIDTLRADHLSCYGYSRNTTPYIDQLSKEAVLFGNALSQAPSTSSAHMSIFTSLVPSVHGVKNVEDISAATGASRNAGQRQLAAQVITWPQVLKEKGYYTVGLHGGVQMSGGFGFFRGFDKYADWGEPDDVRARIEDVRGAIKESKKQAKPLFLFLHYYICHSPYLHAPKEFGLRFLREKVAGLPDYSGRVNSDSDYAAREAKFWENIDLLKPEHRDQVIALYDGGVLFSDYIFGQLVKVFKEEDYYENSTERLSANRCVLWTFCSLCWIRRH